MYHFLFWTLRFLFQGANLLLSPLEIKLSEDLIRNAKFLVTNLEIPYETALQSLKMAKNNNGIIELKNILK